MSDLKAIELRIAEFIKAYNNRDIARLLGLLL